VNALLLIDIQNDFVPGGSLAVNEGDQIIPIVNRLQSHFELVVATQDWHPQNHASFAVNHPGKKPGDRVILNGLEQTLWPVHCVQETPGADFVPALDRSRISHVIQKGTDPMIDSYSGFFDNAHLKATGLAEYLRSQGVVEVFIAGLATDYCVKFTALDALSLGFHPALIEDACRGVNLRPDDVTRSIEEMKSAGVKIKRSSDCL
jgi:nicotinamidase/pyrazinamidase